MLIIGLTGSVASGKNFVADQFKKFNIYVFDADEQVHNILAYDKEVIKKVIEHYPSSIVNGNINRKALGQVVFSNKEKLDILESIIYPVLDRKRQNFLQQHQNKKEKIVILNIPLLFEKGIYKGCDFNILVTAFKINREKRFLDRGKSKDSVKELKNRFKLISQNQMIDSLKRKMSDFVIDNNRDESYVIKQIKKILHSINSDYKIN